MGVIPGLWRWRHNPLRRTTDLVEAWVALVAAVLLVLGAPAAGWVCGSLLNSSLQHTVRVEQQDWHRATATTIADSRDGTSGTFYDPDANVLRGAETRVIAEWTAADGVKHVGTVTGPGAHLAQGDRFTLWSDQQGNQVSPPLTSSVAQFHADFTGVTAAAVAAGVVVCGWRITMWRLVRKRYKRLDRDWAHVGPDWGRTGTGS
jgi:hypothetical protein